MSRDALRALVQERAFNATPRRDDLGAKHFVKSANNPHLHIPSQCVVQVPTQQLLSNLQRYTDSTCSKR